MPILLVFTVLLPLLAGLVLIVSPRAEREQARNLALGTASITLLLSLVFAAGYDADKGPLPQFVSVIPWMTLGADGAVTFSLGLDGISLWLFIMTPLLVIVSLLCSRDVVTERAGLYYGLILCLTSFLLGLFASLDVILFYICFELTLIPTFFLISYYGGPERRQAAIAFFFYTLAGSVLTMAGIVALTAVHYQYSETHQLTFSIAELTKGLATLKWDAWHTPGSLFAPGPQTLIFLLLLAGFAVKLPLFPFHGWLPLTYQQAPTAVTILLAGVMSKLGAYGLIRFNIGMVPLGVYDLYPILAALSVIAILYGALNALAQTNLKQLIAYSSLSHMGFIALGLFSLSPTGVDGALLQMVNHAITTGALFFGVAMLHQRYQTHDMDLLSGVWNKSPAIAGFVIVSALASAAVPGLNGFTGEFPILMGSFETNARVGFWASLGMILGAYYLIVMVKHVIFGPTSELVNNDKFSRPPARHESVAMWSLVALMVLLGVRPIILTVPMRNSLDNLEKRIADAKPVPTPAPAPGPVTEADLAAITRGETTR